MKNILKKIRKIRKRAAEKTLEVIIVFSIIALSISCNSPGSESNDSVPAVEESGSEIHGGSPANVTWSECDQQIGSHPCDFSFIDQYGDAFTLYDNYGKVIVLDFSTMWCGVCQHLAVNVESYQEKYKDHNFLWVTILVDDAAGEEVDRSDIVSWATTYGIQTSPVLAGNRSIIDSTAETGYPISGWPTFVVIDRDMKIANGIIGWSESTVLGWVESEL